MDSVTWGKYLEVNIEACRSLAAELDEQTLFLSQRLRATEKSRRAVDRALGKFEQYMKARRGTEEIAQPTHKYTVGDTQYEMIYMEELVASPSMPLSDDWTFGQYTRRRHLLNTFNSFTAEFAYSAEDKPLIVRFVPDASVSGHSRTITVKNDISILVRLTRLAFPLRSIRASYISKAGLNRVLEREHNFGSLVFFREIQDNG